MPPVTTKTAKLFLKVNLVNFENLFESLNGSLHEMWVHLPGWAAARIEVH